METNGYKCVVCGEHLQGKQRKYCSPKCIYKYYNKKRAQKGYYKKRYKEKWLKKGLVCHVCGKLLPPFKQKYCSYKCYIINKNKLNTLIFDKEKVLPHEAPINCIECGNRVVMMSDGEYVCKGCGLVY